MQSSLSKGSGTGLAGLALARTLFKGGSKYFSANQNQIKCMVKNRSGIEQLGYEPWNTSKVRRLSKL